MKKTVLQFFSFYKYQLLILAVSIIYAYYGLWNTFFFADAWQILDTYPLLPKYGVSYFFQLFVMPYGIHFVPIGVLITTAQAYFFGTNILDYAILSLILHLCIAFLVFYSIFHLIKRKNVALLGGVFFAVNAQIREGVFWFASNTWTEIGTGCVLLGLLAFVSFYNNKKTSTFLIASLLFIAAIFLREYSFMLFPVIIVFLLIMFWKEKKRKYLVFIGLYLLIIVSYLILREILTHTSSQVVLSADNISLAHLFYLIPWYLITLPPKFIATMLIPTDTMVEIANSISKNIYFELSVAQTAQYITVLFYDQLFIFFGFILFALTIFASTKINIIAIEERFSLWVYGVAFYLLPLVFLALRNYLYWIFSRYLYLPTAVFIIFFFSIIGLIPIMKKVNIVSVVASSICLILILTNAFANHTYFTNFVKASNYRVDVLRTVSKKLNWDKPKQILYIKTNTGSLTNSNDIFDIGTSFGKELLIWNWYQDSNRTLLPGCLFDPIFLFKNPVNGYEQCDGKGFGYFQDINQLNNTIRRYHIDPHVIVALSYNQRTNKFTSIDSKIIKKLKR